MTVIVTRGLIVENKSGQKTVTARPQQTPQIPQTPVSSQATGVNTANTAVALGVVRIVDAALPAVRVGRASGLSEKVRDPKEASRLAEDVGDRIRQEDEGDPAHRELVYSSAREHFV
jgi:hypothetical protein